MLKELLPALALVSSQAAIAQTSTSPEAEVITLKVAQRVNTLIQLERADSIPLPNLLEPSELIDITPISLDLSRNHDWQDTETTILPIGYEPLTLADGNLLARAINRQIQGAQSRREQAELVAQVEWAGWIAPQDFGPLILSNNPGVIRTQIEVDFDGFTLEQINDSTGLLGQTFVNPENLSIGQLGDGVGVRFSIPLGGGRDN